MLNSSRMSIYRRTGSIIGVAGMVIFGGSSNAIAEDSKDCMQCQRQKTLYGDISTIRNIGEANKSANVKIEKIEEEHEVYDFKQLKKRGNRDDDNRNAQKQSVDNNIKNADDKKINNSNFEIIEEGEEESSSLVPGEAIKEPKKSTYVIMREKDKDENESRTDTENAESKESYERLNGVIDQGKRIEKNEKAISGIAENISDHNKSISHHENAIEKINVKLHDQVEGIKIQNDLSNRQLDRIKKNEKYIESAKEKYTIHGDMLDKHDNRISKNESDVRNLFKDSAIMNGVISRHEDAFDIIERGLDDHSEAIDSHERRLSGNERRLDKNENAIGGLVGDGAARDKAILSHDQAIGQLGKAMNEANIRSDQQDKTLSDHGRSIAGNESAIRDVQRSAVYYDRDDDGRRSGVLTLRGAGNAPVRLRSVAAGKDGKDAANVDQLSDAVKYLGGGAAVKLDGSISGPTYTIAGKTYDNVGDALKASDRLGVRYIGDENGKPTNSIVLSGDGTGMPVDISNVAPATRNTDAPNYAQLRQVRQDSFNYADQRFGELEASTNHQFSKLSGDISKSRQEARSGIASALAAAGLRFDDHPGKGSIATSLGSFKGATAVAAGLGYTGESGNWRVNAALAHSFATNDTSWNVGASWTFD